MGAKSDQKSGFPLESLPRRCQDAPRRPQDAPKTPPRRPQDVPRCSQDAPRRLQNAPRCPQDSPRPFQDASWLDFGPHVGRFFIDFEGFWNPTCLILASISLPFCIHFCLSSWLPDHTPVYQSSHWSPMVGAAVTRRRRFEYEGNPQYPCMYKDHKI